MTAPRRTRSRIAAALREATFWLFLHCGYVQLRDALLSALGQSRAVIVYYHRIGGCDVLGTPVEQFRRQLQYLSGRYRCISLSELCRQIHSGKPLRRRVVAITFDDGYRDNLLQAVPALLEAGVPATFFVSTGFIGGQRDFPHDVRAGTPAHPKLGWDDLRAMEAAGFEVGSHTVEHTNLGRDAAAARSELQTSLQCLNRELGLRPRAFSFPWGKPGDVSNAARQIARELGYYAACSGYGGVNRRGIDLMQLRRVDVGNGRLSMLAFAARIAGFDPDYLRYRRVARARRLEM